MAERNPQCGEWHKSPAFLELVRNFSENCGRSPSVQNMKAAKGHFTPLGARLRDYLIEAGVASNLHHQGSSYEGIKTRASILEFDCLIVLKGGHQLSKQGRCPPGFERLKVAAGSPLMARSKDGVMSVDKVKRYFMGEMTKALTALQLSNQMILRANGPAVQIDVFHPGTKQIWYSVDMVAGFEVPIGSNPRSTEFYVAKQYKQDDTTWRRSFSKEEKEMLVAIDRGCGCRKDAVRMLKVIREIEDPLKSLQSYFIKTTLLSLIRDQPGLSWDRKQMGLRFVDMLSTLKNYLENGNLPHRFVPEMNLLEDYKPQVLKNMANRLARLLNSQTAMTELLQRRLQ